MNDLGTPLLRIRRCIAIGTLFLVAPGAAGDDSLRCGQRLVDVGAAADLVVSRCGEPDHVERWDGASQYGIRAPSGIEEWYYNRGPHRFLKILRMVDGRLKAITTDGYGFRDTGHGRCNPYDLADGWSAYRLLVQCGPPDGRRAVQVFVPLTRHHRYRHPNQRGVPSVHGRAQRLAPVYRQDWFYNFGPRYLRRQVRLENGRIVEVTRDRPD